MSSFGYGGGMRVECEDYAERDDHVLIRDCYRVLLLVGCVYAGQALRGDRRVESLMIAER